MSQQPKIGELQERTVRGPFGGIQSEVPLDFVEQVGFADAENVIFRKAAAYSRPGLSFLSSLPSNDSILGVFNFFTLRGDRRQVVMTTTSMFLWDGVSQTWTQIVGNFTGGTANLFSADVVGGKLFFSQGVDRVQVWDGVTQDFSPILLSVPCKHIFELGFHLLMCNTIETGVTPAPQRVRWSGAGDGTDLTSFSSGQADLYNNLGPITGGCKLFQQGYIFQQWGITQVQLTGIGLAPFAFYGLGAKAKGNICPYSLASFGEDFACYVGKEEIYRFDGSYSIPIGSQPIDGNRRIGARKRIFADLAQCNLGTIFGMISTGVNGDDFLAYWLFMPELKQAWVYHFDESNWTRFTFDKRPSIAGEFNTAGELRIMDLVGMILDQTWSPATLVGNNPLDSLFVGFDDGTPSEVSFGIANEKDSVLRSGQCTFGDYRHEHIVKKFRVIQQDNGPVTLTLRVANEKGIVDSKTFDIGNGSGLSISRVVEFNISGRYITWQLTCPAGMSLGLSEITPIYDQGGELRGGS